MYKIPTATSCPFLLYDCMIHTVVQYKRLNRDKEIIFFIYDLLVLIFFLKTEIAALTPFGASDQRSSVEIW